MALLRIEPPPVAPPPGFALFDLGFRPFFLLAGAFAALSVACWTIEFTGWSGSHAWLRDPLWHAHEMIFGYAFAVIVGFLFTAGRNWTQHPTPRGALLAGIAALWVTARICVLADQPLPAAAADTAFALAAALGLAHPLWKSRNRRNYFFVPLLAGLGCANLVFCLATAGRIDLPLRLGLQIGLDLILFVISVMGGRVIPMFTNGGVAGAGAVRLPWLERVSLGSVLALLAADLLAAPAVVVACICAAAALAHAARLALWRPLRTLRVPIVWILHASYAWIGIALGLRALAGFELVPVSAAAHALTVGAIGGLTLGMMTRVARGDTGRALVAGSVETAAFALVQAAALVRVLVPLAAPPMLLAAVTASAALWVAAFSLFTFTYWPILPRARGRPAGLSVDFATVKTIHLAAVTVAWTLFTLRGGRPKRARIAAWAAAQMVFGYIVAVAVLRDPMLWPGTR